MSDSKAILSARLVGLLDASDPSHADFWPEQAVEFGIGLAISTYIRQTSDSAPTDRSTPDVLFEGIHADDAVALAEWFRKAGFGVALNVAPGRQHSDLRWVAAHRTGIPIALALLLVEGARRCGLRAYGLNYPGHFLVEVDGVILDPVSLNRLEPEQLNADVPQATPRMIALRMMNNLKALALNAHDLVEALNLVDVQMAIAEDRVSTSTLHYERGELWQRLGAYQMAREAFLACASISPIADLSQRAEERARALDERTDTLH